MLTTRFLQIDFTDIVEAASNFVNSGPNLGTPPNANWSGLDAGPWVSGGPLFSAGSLGFAQYTWNANHSTATPLIPSTARIHRITIQMQWNGISGTADFDGTIGSPLAASTTVFGLFSLASPNPLWVTSSNFPDMILDQDTFNGPGAFDIGSSIGPDSRLVEIVFDFEQNPNGDFPLLFMDYATFIANFTAYDITYGVSAEVGTQSAGSGTYSAGINVNSANLSIDVEWDDPFSVTGWTVTPTTLTLPDNIITLQREPPVTEEDDEEIEKVKVGEKEIGPDDPWVILWTKFTITLKIPPDEMGDDPDIQVQFRGTEFSGFVPLITLIINTADLSGIYEFDIDAHTDTLYDRTDTPTTQEVAIPAPFFVTHFLDNKESDILHFTGTRMRVTGSGTLHQQMVSLDYVNTEEIGDNTLRTTNNRSPFTLSNFVDQQGALRVWTDAIGEFMNVSEIIVFFKKLFTGYPQ